MTVPDDIAAAGQHWATTPLFGQLVEAIERAEGGPEAFLRAIQCSVPVQTRAQAIEVACRTITHRLLTYLVEHDLEASFILYLAKTWAPPHVANDPRGLNAHWAANVLTLFAQAHTS